MSFQWLRIASLTTLTLTAFCSNAQAQGDGYTYTGGAGALFLFREDPNACPIVQDTDHNEVFGADLFNFDMQTGIDARLGVWFDDVHAIESRFFCIDSWMSTASSTTTNGYWIGAHPAIGEDDVPMYEQINMEGKYLSSLKSFEIYFLSYSHVPWFGCSAGYRYIGLDEELSMSFIQDIDKLVAGSYSGTTTNNLHGFKLDAHLLVWEGDLLTVGVDGEAGIYGNQAKHTANYTGLAGDYAANGCVNRASFVGDLSFWAGVWITTWLECRVAYELLWIDGVALGSDQPTNTDFNNGTGTNANSSIFYNGLSVVGLIYY